MRMPDFEIDEAKTLALMDRLGLTEALAPQSAEDETEGKEAPKGPLDFGLKDGGENLSGGQQQRVGLLRSLQVQRPVMILDEATSDLDEASPNDHLLAMPHICWLCVYLARQSHYEWLVLSACPK